MSGFVSLQEGTMKLRLIQISIAVALAVHGLAHAYDTDPQTGPLGKVSFPTSCDPKVQPAFRRAVACRIRSGIRLGEGIPQRAEGRPQCAIATWGIASILMSNPLAGQGASPKGAEQAQAAIDEDAHRCEDRTRARLHQAVAAY
jgi:hypothetical protein